MSYPIATVTPEATVLEAIRRMAGEKKGSVLVARDGLLKECLGIVTTSQIFLEVFARGRDPAAVAVSEIMTPAPLITIDLDASTSEAARLMQSTISEGFLCEGRRTGGDNHQQGSAQVRKMMLAT